MATSDKSNVKLRSEQVGVLEQADLDTNFQEVRNVITDASNNESAFDDHLNKTNPHDQYAADTGADLIGTASTRSVQGEFDYQQSETNKRLLREELIKKATLDLNFAQNRYEVYTNPVDGMTQKPLKNIVSYTRSGEAFVRTPINGLARVGVDNQRLIGNREGILSELTATNLFLQSQSFDSSPWGTLTAFINPDVEVAPDGTSTADKFGGSVGSTNMRLRQTISSLSVGTYTYSIFVKAGEYDNLRVGRLNTNIGIFTHTFDLTAETAAGGAKIEKWGNGWYRCYGQVEVLTAGDSGIQFTAQESATGDGTSGIFIWGAQFEAGSVPTTYIESLTSAGVRGVERIGVYDLDNWFNPDSFTIYGELTVEEDGAGGRFLSVGGGGSGNRITIRTGAPGIYAGGGVNQSFTGLPALSAGQTIRLAYAYNGTTLTFAVDGEIIDILTVSSKITGINNFRINESQTGSIYARGIFPRALSIPYSLSSTELQALTSF